VDKEEMNMNLEQRRREVRKCTKIRRIYNMYRIVCQKLEEIKR